jgi:hypothetical protein
MALSWSRWPKERLAVACFQVLAVRMLNNPGTASSNDKDRNFCITNMYFLYRYTQQFYTAVCKCILNGQHKNRQKFGRAIF